jgi:putative mRNA 3-end processing factor
MRPPLELRPEGLYCPPGDFYVDPALPVAKAVLTHAHGDHARPGSAHYHCAEPGLGLLRWRLGEQGFHAHAYGEPFTLGRTRLTLHPAGHILGSAQLSIDCEGRRWVVSGDYKRAPDPTCDAFEPVRCDGFLTEATFALPVYRWPCVEDVIGEILAWWRECASRGEAAVLSCYALGKAQRILAELARIPLPELPAPLAWLHGAMLEPTRLYREAGVALLPTRPVIGDEPRKDFAGALVLAPPSTMGSPWLKRIGPRSTGHVSGWMRLRGNRRRRNVDRGFVLSDHADWPGLLRSIAESGARQVLATHGDGHALVRWLRDQGTDAGELRADLAGGDP